MLLLEALSQQRLFGETLCDSYTLCVQVSLLTTDPLICFRISSSVILLV